MAPKKTKPQSTELTKWDEELAQYAEQSAAQEKPSGFKSINIKSGFLHVDGDPVEGNELSVVVLGSLHENQFYEGRYDPDNVNTPICYAFGDPTEADPEASMKPHPQAPSPQHDNCKECPNNQWGSADTGRGKACKNVRRLAVLSADALEDVEELGTAEVRSLKVSVTNVKGWASYKRGKLLELKRPEWAVVTNVKVVPDAKTQFKINFGFEELVDFGKVPLPQLKSKAEAAVKELMAPYPVFDEKEEAPAPARNAKVSGGKGKARRK